MTNYIEEIREEFPWIKVFEEDDENKWLLAGRKALIKSRFDDAEINFKKVLLAQPKHHDGFEGLAYTYYLKSGNEIKALWFMTEAVKRAREFLKDDSIDIEVIKEMEDNLKRMEKGKTLNDWWKV